MLEAVKGRGEERDRLMSSLVVTKDNPLKPLDLLLNWYVGCVNGCGMGHNPKSRDIHVLGIHGR